MDTKANANTYTNGNTNPTQTGTIKKTKTKTKHSSSADAAKKKNDPVKTEKKKPQDAAGPEKTKYCAQLIDVWFLFNEKHFGDRPSFAGADPRHLKSILDVLEKRATAKNIDWTEPTARDRLEKFLETAFKDEWMSKNFLLTHLVKFIDKFILNQNGNTNKGFSGGGAGGKKTGGSIDDLQALKRGATTAAYEDTYSGGAESNKQREEWAEADVVE